MILLVSSSTRVQYRSRPASCRARKCLQSRSGNVMTEVFLTRLSTHERTGPDIATWFIGTHHDASGRNLRANEPQRERLGGLAKEALAPTKHHWKSPHVV